MTALPNPFLSSALERAIAADAAAGPAFADSPVPAAAYFPRGFHIEAFVAAITLPDYAADVAVY